MTDSIWNDELRLQRYEDMREEARLSGRRLTFDCFNLKTDGERATCSKGKKLGISKDGSTSVVKVLSAVTSRVCLGCRDYNS